MPVAVAQLLPLWRSGGNAAAEGEILWTSGRWRGNLRCHWIHLLLEAIRAFVRTKKNTIRFAAGAMPAWNIIAAKDTREAHCNRSWVGGSGDVRPDWRPTRLRKMLSTICSVKFTPFVLGSSHSRALSLWFLRPANIRLPYKEFGRRLKPGWIGRSLLQVVSG